MEMCHRENLYQIDLLHGSANRVTEREYWAKRKGQAELDEKNAEIKAAGLTPRTTKFETDKEKLRQTLRKALDTATTFDEYSELLLRQGISVKESRGRLSYLTPDRTKPITARKLGDDFDRVAVLARLEQNAQRGIEEKAQRTQQQSRSIVGRLREAEKTAKAQNEQRVQRMVDVEAKRAQSAALGQWASVHNLKQMASSQFIYDTTGYSSLEEFDAAVSAAKEEMQASVATLKSFDTKIKENEEMQNWLVSYAKTRDVRERLKNIKSEKKRATYRAEHESDFVVVEAATRYFKSHGITKLPTRKALQAEKEQLISEKNAAYCSYKEQQARYRELSTIQRNLAELHNRPQPQKSKKHENEL